MTACKVALSQQQITGRSGATTNSSLRRTSRLSAARGSRTRPCGGAASGGCYRAVERGAFQQPGVHLGDASLSQSEVAVVGSQSGVDSGDVLRKPNAVPVRNEVVLLALPELHRHADGGEVKAPRSDEGEGVVDPSIAAC